MTLMLSRFAVLLNEKKKRIAALETGAWHAASTGALYHTTARSKRHADVSDGLRRPPNDELALCACSGRGRARKPEA